LIPTQYLYGLWLSYASRPILGAIQADHHLRLGYKVWY